MLENGTLLFLVSFWLFMDVAVSSGHVSDLDLVGLELTAIGRLSKFCWGQIQTLLMFS